MPNPRRNYYQRGIGYILFTAGVVLTVVIGSSVLRGYNTHDWQQTSGIMYRSTMVQTTQLGEQPLYQPDVSYRYQINGETFVGENLYRTDLPFNDERELGKELDEFPTGSLQMIYVNPEYPEESVLIPGVQNQLILGLIFAIACFAIGLSSFRRQ